ncbi:MAG: MoaD/ThiS family protein, partial [Candidatus Geothermarchaeales archaeon]
MPRIRVRLLPILSNIAGVEEVDLRFEGKTNLGRVLEELCARYGQGFKKVLFDVGTGRPWGNVRITVNQVFVELDALERVELRDGDVVSITPP